MTPAFVILSTWSTLDSVRATVLSSKLGVVVSASSCLAAMMAAFAVLSVAAEYIDGHGVGVWQLMKPIVLLVLVCQFSTLVLTPVNSLVNVFTRELAASTEVSTKEYTEQWAHNTAYVTALNMDSNRENYLEELDEIAGSDTSAIGKFFAKIWTAIRKAVIDIFSTATFTIAGIIGAILFIIVKILLFGQQVLCSMYLTIAGLIGPIVFALAILPSFASGIRSWLARYIQIAMWIPMGYLVLDMNLSISNMFCSQAAADGASLSLEWFMIALQTVALVSIASVPKLAAWVVESTGANDAHGSLSQSARTVTRTLFKF